jgi:hypothetical protein
LLISGEVIVGFLHGWVFFANDSYQLLVVLSADTVSCQSGMEKPPHLLILSCFLFLFPLFALAYHAGQVMLLSCYWLLTRDLYYWALVRGVKPASYCAAKYLVAAADVAGCYWLDSSEVFQLRTRGLVFLGYRSS